MDSIKEQIVKDMKAGIVSVIDNKIFKIEHHNDYEIELEDIEELISLYNDFREQGLVDRILIVGAGHTTITPEARKFAQSNIFDTIGEGIVVGSLQEKIIANFYFLVKKKSYPIKVFKSESAATNWLNSL